MMDVLITFLIGAVLYPPIDRLLADRRRQLLAARLAELERTYPNQEERNRVAVTHFERAHIQKAVLILLLSLPFLVLLLSRLLLAYKAL